jgi:FtsP/CotA-like multicopper oxidase with cupredoxin domain
VQLDNRTDQDTIIHWHGQTPPVDQDGVALTGTEYLIRPGASQPYDFAPRAGTHWMHSHQGMQEMQLMSAPLVVRTQDDLRMDAQEVTVILHDFTFRSPEQVMASVTGGSMPDMPGMSAGAAGERLMPGMTGGMAGMPAADMRMTVSGAGGGADLNDFDYDAYLANDRTLDDPQVVRVERGGRVRLRVINAAASTAFWLDLGALTGTVIAVDGTLVRPIAGNRFPLAEAQRLDIEVIVPAGGVSPVLAQRVGDRLQTGIILAARGAGVVKVAASAATPAGPTDPELELRLTALQPLAERPIDVRHRVVATGSMRPYQWMLNGRRGWADHEPLRVKQGQRVAIDLVNQTAMAHPMHLHGHSFQVIALNGQPINGAVRDVVQLPANGAATIAFDADNPGRWLFHCHNMLHMETGMITEVSYEP